MLKHRRPSQDITEAETLWGKEIQKSLSKNPKVEIWKRHFGIFTGEHGIMKRMGRLSQAQLPASAKYPRVTISTHYITISYPSLLEPQANDTWWCEVKPHRTEIKILDSAG